MLEQHRDQLAAEAAAIVREHPHAQPVGVILDADAAEFRRLFLEQSDQPVAGFVGVMPRKMLLELLRTNHPAFLDWLEDSVSEGVERVLPLVAITKDGIRGGRVRYTVEG